MRPKVKIGIAVLLIAASPFVLLYSAKFFHWLKCGNTGESGYIGVNTCGGLDFFVYNVYAIGLALLFALVGCVLIYITTLNDKNKS